MILAVAFLVILGFRKGWFKKESEEGTDEAGYHKAELDGEPTAKVVNELEEGKRYELDMHPVQEMQGGAVMLEMDAGARHELVGSLPRPAELDTEGASARSQDARADVPLESVEEEEHPGQERQER